jgi:V/A-type H+-transporting ATPase subunit E
LSNIKKGLTALATEILEDVRKEAEEAISEAEKDGKDVLLTAKDEANRQYATITNKAKTEAEAESRKIESLTNVEVRNRLLQKKEDLVNAAFDKALQQLSAFVETQEYVDYLLGLIKETAIELNSKELILHLNARDREKVKRNDLARLSEELGVKLKLAEKEENFMGGCRLQTTDKRMICDNTIENRLQQLKPSLRMEVAKILFGKEE